MKKNNVFLGAYVAFALICCFVQCSGGFPMWGRVVSAITMASVFLSWADFFYTYDKAYSGINDIAKDTISTMEEKVLAKMLTELRDVAHAELDRGKLKEIISNLYEQNSAELVALQKEKKNINWRRKCRFISRFLHISFPFLGILCFLCILVFDGIALVLSEIQDVFSVAAFAIVLLAQYAAGVLAQEKEKAIEKNSEMKDDQQIDRTSISEMYDEFMLIIEAVKKNAN